jgi:hypothetical protein
MEPVNHPGPMEDGFKYGPLAEEKAELEVPHNEHAECSKHNDTYLQTYMKENRGERANTKARRRRTVASGAKVDLAVDRKNHPILYSSLRQTDEINGVKQAVVVYPPKFKRLVRLEAEKGNKKNTRGRPRKGTAWADYEQKGKTALCSCGRRFQGTRGKFEHCRSKGKRGSACKIIRIQENRSQCFFCGIDIEPSIDYHKIEEHTLCCVPLTELKKLIPQEHLEDDGLQPAEMHAFDWPIAPL